MMDLPERICFLAGRCGLTFAHPGHLNWMWLLPVFILLAALIWRKRRRGLVAALGFRLTAAAVAILALAGLSLGTRRERPAAVIAAVDVSDSMGEEGRRWAMAGARQWLERAGAESRAGAILFARHCESRTLSEAEDKWNGNRAFAETDGTDIGSAIVRACLSFPAEAPKRLLIFSDGNETTGDASAAARMAGEGGVRIDCFAFPGAEQRRAGLKKLDLPGEVNASDTFTIRVLAENQGQTTVPGRLTIRVGGEIVRKRPVELAPGTNEYRLEDRREAAGVTAVTASLSLPETAPGRREGNKLSGTLLVTEPPKVLFVSGSPRAGALLTEALRSAGIAVSETTPERLPDDVKNLLFYRGIVLSNLPADALDSGQMEALKQFVGDLGRGLVVAGGYRSFSAGGYGETALEEALPVKSDRRPAERREASRFCVIPVIDRSSSMKSGNKIQTAKRAAEELLGVLDERDQAGLITFTNEHDVIFRLQPLLRGKKWRIIDRIRRIKARGGTFMLTALEEALRQLSAASGLKKHIIVITDGFCAGAFHVNKLRGTLPPGGGTLRNKNFSRAKTGGSKMIPPVALKRLRELAAEAGERYQQFFRGCLENHVSVSAIGVGKQIQRSFLKQLAEETGGRFYELKSSAGLVMTVLRDTQRIIADTPNLEQEILPKFEEGSELLKGITGQKFPPLLGYTVTQAREGAEVPLYVERHGLKDPLLAAWQYGLGRSVAFTSDAEARWSAKLVRWPFFRKFWSQVVRWSMRAELGEPYLVGIRRERGKNYLRLETFSPAGGGSAFRLTVGNGENGAATVIPLHQVAPRVWRGEVETLPPAGATVVVERLEGGELAGRKETFLLPLPPPRAERPEERCSGNNRELLGEIACVTGGLLDPETDELDFSPDVVPLKVNLAAYLIPFIFACLLADIALRKLEVR